MKCYCRAARRAVKLLWNTLGLFVCLASAVVDNQLICKDNMPKRPKWGRSVCADSGWGAQSMWLAWLWCSINSQLTESWRTSKCPIGANLWLTPLNNPSHGRAQQYYLWLFTRMDTHSEECETNKPEEKTEKWMRDGAALSSAVILNYAPPSKPAAIHVKRVGSQISKEVQLYPPSILSVLPISCAPRMQSSLDSGTPSQFGGNKGVVRRTLRACAFWLAALHIKQAGLSASAQAAATKSESPAWNTLRILALEFCTGRD